ncbi:MAG: hypothetical protein QOI47_146 [Actinomycetota bacterium]|nr:hypothetical protein [Actinomycetota bacterium]
MVAQVERSVVLEAPPAKVWELLVDDGALSEWFGAEVEIDARPGGRVRVRDEDGERRGTVEVFQPERELAFRVWSPPGDGGMEGSRVDLTLEPLDDEHTVLTVKETQLASRALARA